MNRKDAKNAKEYVKLNWLCALCVFAVGQYAVAQQDTIALEREEAQPIGSDHILVGTCVLEGSHRNNYAANMGYYLREVAMTPCSGSPEEDSRYDMTPDEIVGVTGTGSELTVDVKVISTCGHEFLCEIELVEDSIINIVSTGFGSSAICSCCYGLRYRIILHSELIELAERPMRYVMVNGERGSLKPIPF